MKVARLFVILGVLTVIKTTNAAKTAPPSKTPILPTPQGKPLINNIFDAFQEDSDCAQPRTWKEIYKRIKKMGIPLDTKTVYYPPVWKYCMINHTKPRCRDFFIKVQIYWPWSKRFLPKFVY